ncbi:MAG: hypothetical protein KME46_14400 [Brasilonema angustatum HA4187-MV1]|nr:hypothetical protein [Brasilonema angustatum HA4187-MV1]
MRSNILTFCSIFNKCDLPLCCSEAIAPTVGISVFLIDFNILGNAHPTSKLSSRNAIARRVGIAYEILQYVLKD